MSAAFGEEKSINVSVEKPCIVLKGFLSSKWLGWSFPIKGEICQTSSDGDSSNTHVGADVRISLTSRGESRPFLRIFFM